MNTQPQNPYLAMDSNTQSRTSPAPFGMTAPVPGDSIPVKVGTFPLTSIDPAPKSRIRKEFKSRV